MTTPSPYAKALDVIDPTGVEREVAAALAAMDRAEDEANLGDE